MPRIDYNQMWRTQSMKFKEIKIGDTFLSDLQNTLGLERFKKTSRNTGQDLNTMSYFDFKTRDIVYLTHDEDKSKPTLALPKTDHSALLHEIFLSSNELLNMHPFELRARTQKLLYDVYEALYEIDKDTEPTDDNISILADAEDAERTKA